MIDVGKIPPAILAGIGRVCEFADSYVFETGKDMWADSEDLETIQNYERFLNLLNIKDASIEWRVNNILAYYNAEGKPNVEWFYKLARFLGYVEGNFDGDVRSWSHPEYRPAVYFADGEFLPFRAGISVAGDKVYDNITFGANTCTCYYRQGNAKVDYGAALKDLIRGARNVGTVIRFVNTDDLD